MVRSTNQMGGFELGAGIYYTQRNLKRKKASLTYSDLQNTRLRRGEKTVGYF